MEALNETTVEVTPIYGSFEIVGGYKFWRHNPMLDMSAEEQFNHNCDVDPNFRVLEPLDDRQVRINPYK